MSFLKKFYDRLIEGNAKIQALCTQTLWSLQSNLYNLCSFLLDLMSNCSAAHQGNCSKLDGLPVHLLSIRRHIDRMGNVWCCFWGTTYSTTWLHFIPTLSTVTRNCTLRKIILLSKFCSDVKTNFNANVQEEPGSVIFIKKPTLGDFFCIVELLWQVTIKLSKQSW